MLNTSPFLLFIGAMAVFVWRTTFVYFVTYVNFWTSKWRSWYALDRIMKSLLSSPTTSSSRIKTPGFWICGWNRTTSTTEMMRNTWMETLWKLCWNKVVVTFIFTSKICQQIWMPTATNSKTFRIRRNIFSPRRKITLLSACERKMRLVGIKFFTSGVRSEDEFSGVETRHKRLNTI